MTLVFILKINIHFGFNGLLPFSSVLVYIHVRINVFTRTLRFFSSHLKSHHQPIVGLSSFLDVYVKVVERTLYIYFILFRLDCHTCSWRNWHGGIYSMRFFHAPEFQPKNAAVKSNQLASPHYGDILETLYLDFLKSASFFFLGSDSVLRISMGIIFTPSRIEPLKSDTKY